MEFVVKMMMLLIIMMAMVVEMKLVMVMTDDLVQFKHGKLYPYLTNGFSHHYQLEESTFIFRGVRSNFEILFNFSMKIF